MSRPKSILKSKSFFSQRIKSSVFPVIRAIGVCITHSLQTWVSTKYSNLPIFDLAAGVYFYGKTTEIGIPRPFRATARYSRIHLGFWPRSATLIGQLSRVPVFDTNNSVRYIVPRFFSPAVTAFWRDPHRFLSGNIPWLSSYSSCFSVGHRFHGRSYVTECVRLGSVTYTLSSILKSTLR